MWTRGAVTMGDVATTYKLMPEEPSIDWEEVKKRIEEVVPEPGKIAGMVIKPVAFGLKSLNVVFVIDDKAGGSQAFEDSLNSLQGIQSVEVTSCGLIN